MTFAPVRIRPELLLHPNIPKPLHTVNPRSIKGDAWWNITRRKAYKSNNFCCEACGVHKMDAKYHQWLEAHEDYTVDYYSKRMYIKGIVPLCHACHNYIHSGRLFVQAGAGDIAIERFWAIMEHGCKVLTKANLHWNPFAVSVLLNATEEDGYWKVPEWVKVGWLSAMLSEHPIPIGATHFETDWAEWRLEFDGKEYPPHFPTYEAWEEHYHPRKRRSTIYTDAHAFFDIFDEPF